MSRSGYSTDIDNEWSLVRWRGAVMSAIRGARGQSMLRDLLAALDAMPEKRLVRDALVLTEAMLTGRREFEDPGVCALGALGQVRGLPLNNVDPEDYDKVAHLFGVAPALVQEIVFQNDEQYDRVTPEERWRLMRAWVARHIIEARP